MPIELAGKKRFPSSNYHYISHNAVLPIPGQQSNRRPYAFRDEGDMLIYSPGATGQVKLKDFLNSQTSNSFSRNQLS